MWSPDLSSACPCEATTDRGRHRPPARRVRDLPWASSCTFAWVGRPLPRSRNCRMPPLMASKHDAARNDRSRPYLPVSEERKGWSRGRCRRCADHSREEIVHHWRHSAIRVDAAGRLILFGHFASSLHFPDGCYQGGRIRLGSVRTEVRTDCPPADPGQRAVPRCHRKAAAAVFTPDPRSLRVPAATREHAVGQVRHTRTAAADQNISGNRKSPVRRPQSRTPDRPSPGPVMDQDPRRCSVATGPPRRNPAGSREILCSDADRTLLPSLGCAGHSWWPGTRRVTRWDAAAGRWADPRSGHRCFLRPPSPAACTRTARWARSLNSTANIAAGKPMAW